MRAVLHPVRQTIRPDDLNAWSERLPADREQVLAPVVTLLTVGAAIHDAVTLPQIKPGDAAAIVIKCLADAVPCGAVRQ